MIPKHHQCANCPFRVPLGARAWGAGEALPPNRCCRQLLCLFSLLLVLVFVLIGSGYLVPFYPDLVAATSHGDAAAFRKQWKIESLVDVGVEPGRLALAAHLFNDEPVWDPEELGDISPSTPRCAPRTLALILVTSATANARRRRAIRESWAKVGEPAIKVVFLVGVTSDRDVAAAVAAERSRHNDLLLGRYADTYRNLTLKVLHGMAWAAAACRPDYLLKTDDDCFVNVPVLRTLLAASPRRRLYVGRSPASRAVIRGAANKWHVTPAEYPLAEYPRYASGTGYVLSADVLRDITRAARLVRPFPNEDAFVGVIAARLGVAPINSGRFTSYSATWQACNYHYILLMHTVPCELQAKCLEMALEAPNRCPNGRVVTVWH
ncbi:PREDICTED: beta-1,3-galactosyltransferase 5-like [Priapulus caudatus]|uniref:Hexosyltransferase n=1 Tax=Priapulus caudatus TaxID=37621 RepID=A0ABM1E731_PRICU|nr:PREDICTED: beta-1,3-galactosyltransferase 5-like [Priapulus caudatus]